MSDAESLNPTLVKLVAEAITLRAIDRGHPVHPVVARHLADAALKALLKYCLDRGGNGT